MRLSVISRTDFGESSDETDDDEAVGMEFAPVMVPSSLMGCELHSTEDGDEGPDDTEAVQDFPEAGIVGFVGFGDFRFRAQAGLSSQVYLSLHDD
jgi:hypothetical protein